MVIMRKLPAYILLTGFLLAWAAPAILHAQTKEGGFRLASILQDHMVVQQARPFTLWGWAPAGTKVEARASWGASASVESDSQGRWELQLSVPEAKPGDFKSYRIDIVCGSETLALTDLLIGEVWFCSGQSNMEMIMQPLPPWTRGVTDYPAEIAAADHPNLRICKIKRETSEQVRDTLNAKWSVCTPSSVANFSGVAYYFGRRLLRELNIPVGMVVSSYGGASCQAFIKREVLEADPVLKKNYLDPDRVKPNEQQHLRPMLIYNAIIHPLMKLSVRGILWYQGESNAGDIRGYAHLNKSMIDSWRKEFGQGLLPFYFVQMTPYNWDKDKPKQDPAANRYARFRETQSSILSHPATGMVCTMDVGEPNDIHPINKRPVGERLAALALSNDYGRKVVHSGPVFRDMKVKAEKVRIRFDSKSVSGGLTTSDGQAPRHFFLSGADSVLRPATSSMRGRQIILRAEGVARPVAVRYAFTNYPVTNLQNKEGWPAFPFRTDNWEKESTILPGQQVTDPR